MALKRRTGVILALDVRDRSKAKAVVEATKDYVDAVKVNYPLIWSCGPDFIKEIADSNTVICDLKIADIPYTNRLICEEAFERGCTAVIAHAFVGPDSLRACVDVAERYGGDVYAVVEMSHPGGKDMFEPLSSKLCSIAKECSATGVIAPATRPERISKIRGIIGSEMQILSPGVGAQGGSASEAIKNGANFVIVGRSIYNAKDPGKAAKGIAADVQRAMEGRLLSQEKVRT